MPCPKLRLLALVGIALFAVIASSCNDHDFAEVCNHDVPKLHEEVVDAYAALNSVYSEVTAVRGLASVHAQGANTAERVVPRIRDDQRGDWATWARRSLSTVQEYLDITDEDPALRGLRPELYRIADDFVSLHGYAEAGNLPRMVETLDRVQKRLQGVRDKFCGLRVSVLSKVD